MEKSPLILERCPKVENDKVSFEKYLGLDNKNRNFYPDLESPLKDAKKYNFKYFYSYLIK